MRDDTKSFSLLANRYVSERGDTINLKVLLLTVKHMEQRTICSEFMIVTKL